jgi:predicted acetyltransferase
MEDGLTLIRPNYDLKSEYLDMIEEWEKSKEKIIPWSLNLDTSNFELMLNDLDGYSNGIGLENGFVESSTYWLINKSNRVLGAIDIRHRLNETLLYRGGHIGYGIRPSERKKGYATKMLQLALEVCKSIGLSRVLITCSKTNIGSARTIINNSGFLESEETDNDGEIFQRYWIDLSNKK